MMSNRKCKSPIGGEEHGKRKGADGAAIPAGKAKPNHNYQGFRWFSKLEHIPWRHSGAARWASLRVLHRHETKRAGLCLLRHVQQGASMALPAKTRAVYPGLPVWAERVFRADPVRRYMHRVIIGGHVLPGYAGIGRENRSSGPKMGHACGEVDRLQTAVGLRRRPNRG